MLSQVGMPYEECIQALKSLRSDYVRPTGPGTVVSSRTAAMASLWGMNTPFSSLFRPKWSLSMDGRPSTAAGLSLKRAPASNPRLAKLQASPFGNYDPDLAYRALPWSMEILLVHSRKPPVMRRRPNPDHLPIPPPLQVVLAAT